ncbi:hypothetical protein BDP27DRAFT_1373896 [Rhodocollybia butyracea]|uniref:Uncharacterized protein n=1 Tax=Rhodocollybia butyracea TaxID=206335 RepID=A0A9P5P2N7_9AGAR|nr:hypothetical protein BDP27DRAFT_1373896 [Rhodocollybia butyracea]
MMLLMELACAWEFIVSGLSEAHERTPGNPSSFLNRDTISLKIQLFEDIACPAKLLIQDLNVGAQYPRGSEYGVAIWTTSVLMVHVDAQSTTIPGSTFKAERTLGQWDGRSLTSAY